MKDEINLREMTVISEAKVAALRARFERCKQEIGRLDWLSEGSVSENHPGTWRWTRKVRAKTVTVALSAAPTVGDVEDLVAATGFSRFPLRTNGHLAGYLHVKDILDIANAEPSTPVPAVTEGMLIAVSIPSPPIVNCAMILGVGSAT